MRKKAFSTQAGSLCYTAILAWLIPTTTWSQPIEIEFVEVGAPGNEPDTRHNPSGFGAVDYRFAIGKHEITLGQYRAFLNAKAAVGDPHDLYHPEMAVSPHNGIDRIGSGTSEDPWIYFPRDGDLALDNLPVNFIGMWDAARFVNWLHNGQGDGDTETGAYVGIGDEATMTRQPGARYFIPTEDEWYKAAYYDPNKPGGAGYWEYPTRSDALPSNEPPPGTDMANGSANFGRPQLTPVGAYNARPSTSPWGTYDQGGNLWEWNETLVTDGDYGLRGGSFDNIYGLEASHRDFYPATFENRIMGLRVAAAVTVPEPAAWFLMLVGILLCGRRVRRA